MDDLHAGVDGSGALVAAWDGSPEGFENDSVFSVIVPAGSAPGGRALALWSASDHSGATGDRRFLSERDATERATVAVSIPRPRGSRRTAIGTLVRASAGPGALAIAFSGRIGRTAFAPGTYAATVIAIDGAGNRSVPATVNLTIVRK